MYAIIADVALFALLVSAFVTDVATKKIPNKLTLGFVLAGLLLHLLADSWPGLWFAVLGMAAGFMLLFILYLLRAVGAGDVKLFAAIGAVSGAATTADILMTSIVLAGVVGLAILLGRKLLADRFHRFVWIVARVFILREYKSVVAGERGDLLTFPFMLAVLPAAILVYAFRY